MLSAAVSGSVFIVIVVVVVVVNVDNVVTLGVAAATSTANELSFSFVDCCGFSKCPPAVVEAV